MSRWVVRVEAEMVVEAADERRAGAKANFLVWDQVPEVESTIVTSCYRDQGAEEIKPECCGCNGDCQTC